jgi:hypothetical protein
MYFYLGENHSSESLFWDVTLRRLVIIYRVSGQPVDPNFKNKAVQKMHAKAFWL